MSIVSQDGEIRILESFVGSRDIKLRLFVNDVKESRFLKMKDFIEPELGGYTPISLMKASWVVKESSPVVAEYPKVRFRFSGKVGRVFGYFYEQGGRVISMHKFPEDEPVYVNSAGDEIRIVPHFSVRMR